MTVTLAQLLEGSPTLEVARPNESVAEAMERMREHDYSQLPVVEDGAAELRAIGLISMASISRASLYLDIAPSKLRVHHAIDRDPNRRSLDDELWRTLDVGRNGEVLLVEDDAGVLRGILTGQDFTTYLRRQAEDSLTVLDIEAAVKQLIDDNYRDRAEELRKIVERELGVQHRDNEKGVRAVVSRCLSALDIKFNQLDPAVLAEAFEKAFPNRVTYEFDRLTFSQYQNILLTGECWEAYREDFDLPVEHLRALLDVARNLRNQIMHNRGLPTPAERAKLGYCRELLGRVADRRQVAAAVVEAPVVVEPEVEPTDLPEETPEADDERRGEQSFVPWSWLARFEKAWLGRVVLSFKDIEGFTRSPLPPAAHEHRSWWTNDEAAPQAAQWLDVSWRIMSVNLTQAQVTFGRNTTREETLISTFGVLFRRLGENPAWSLPARSPIGRTTQNIGSFRVHDCAVMLGFGFASGNRFRISAYLDGSEQNQNKAVFDALAARRDDLERGLGSTLVWERNPHRRASRVSLMYPCEISIMAGDEAVEQLANWVAEYVPRFWTAVRETLETD